MLKKELTRGHFDVVSWYSAQSLSSIVDGALESLQHSWSKIIVLQLARLIVGVTQTLKFLKRLVQAHRQCLENVQYSIG